MVMKRRMLLGVVLISAFAFSGSSLAQNVLRIGFFPGPYADQFKRGVQPTLEREGIKVQAIEMTNIIQLNSALMDGSLDANVFQNRAYMETSNVQLKGDLVEVLQVPSAPLGLYSKRITDLKQLKPGSTVSMSNDATNLARALVFLQLHGLIKLDPAIPPTKVSEKNVVGNPLNLKFVLIDAPAVPRSLEDVDLAAILGNHVIASGMLLSSALALEDPAPEYRIIVVARKGVASTPLIQKLAAAYKSNDYRKFSESDPKTKGFSKPEYWK